MKIFDLAATAFFVTVAYFTPDPIVICDILTKNFWSSLSWGRMWNIENRYKDAQRRKKGITTYLYRGLLTAVKESKGLANTFSVSQPNPLHNRGWFQKEKKRKKNSFKSLSRDYAI